MMLADAVATLAPDVLHAVAMWAAGVAIVALAYRAGW
jgi:hypothetical protein